MEKNEGIGLFLPLPSMPADLIPQPGLPGFGSMHLHIPSSLPKSRTLQLQRGCRIPGLPSTPRASLDPLSLECSAQSCWARTVGLRGCEASCIEEPNGSLALFVLQLVGLSFLSAPEFKLHVARGLHTAVSYSLAGHWAKYAVNKQQAGQRPLPSKSLVAVGHRAKDWRPGGAHFSGGARVAGRGIRGSVRWRGHSSNAVLSTLVFTSLPPVHTFPYERALTSEFPLWLSGL